ncbi:uncharacterized protein LOC129791370 [Lutzomyia longipalpis]|uniref:uncharacterized protein LOC129791370 n=1 Tax=Lutzomyia longipalpis TaxID=7200 RepID=UPI002483C05F|nr:uncharacterized protein LOC129791370 [Lutzomyia longipalpis]
MSLAKKVKRENLNYIDLLQQSIENTEEAGGGDPLSEQIIEEEEMVVEEEQYSSGDHHDKKVVDLVDSFDVSVDNQYEISAGATKADGGRDGDSDDEIRITVKRKKSRGGGHATDTATLNDIYMLLLSMDKRISNIEKWMKNTTGNGSLSINNTSVITKLLPMKTVQELKEFDDLLEEPDFENAYISFVQNAELKDLMDDNVIINFNYSGVHKKLALKSYRFIQVWKDNSNLPESEFAKNLKIEIGAAHNRHHSRRARLRKSAGGSS